ncbi:MAG TPA: MBL fold metallo-hydrolase, partial [Rudaea sp.]|nr:MBL fold metallo-hydrolase [Rudaea sp.]
IARAHASDADRHERIMEDLAQLYISRVRAHGCTLDDAGICEVLVMDIELNAQGLEVWLDRPPR